MQYKISSMVSQRAAFGQGLIEKGAENPNLVVLDADVCCSTQTHLFREAYPERFFQVGIAEQNMLGIAAGMASMGLIPFVSAFAVFLTERGGDQIRNSIAHPRANVKLNGAYCGLPTGRGGATHSAVEDIAVMRCLPNMVILDPADATETRLCIDLAMEIEGPVYLRTVRCEVPTIFGPEHQIKLGRAVKLLEGNDITVISSGMMTGKAKAAGAMLEKQGIHIDLLHMPSIKPLDEEAVIESAAKTGKVITVENHSVIGGLGSAVCELLSKKYPVKTSCLGFPDIFLQCGADEELFSRYGMNTENIADTILKRVK